MGRAELDRRLEIGAHAHREQRQAVAPGDGVEQREMRRGRVLGRRDAHQPLDDKAVALAAFPQERIGRGGHDAALLRLLAGVDLDEEARLPPGPSRPFGQRLGQRLGEGGPVEGVDDVEELDRLLIAEHDSSVEPDDALIAAAAARMNWVQHET